MMFPSFKFLYHFSFLILRFVPFLVRVSKLLKGIILLTPLALTKDSPPEVIPRILLELRIQP